MPFKTSYTIAKLKSILSENGVQIPTDRDRQKQFYVDLYYELLVERTIARLQHLSTEDLASYLQSAKIALPLTNGLLDRELCLQRYARYLVDKNSATLDSISVPLPKRTSDDNTGVDLTLPSSNKNVPVYYTPPSTSPVPPTWDPFVPPPPSPNSVFSLTDSDEDVRSNGGEPTLTPSSPTLTESSSSVASSTTTTTTTQRLKPIKFDDDRGFRLPWILLFIEVLVVAVIALFLHDPQAFNDHLQQVVRLFDLSHHAQDQQPPSTSL